MSYKYKYLKYKTKYINLKKKLDDGYYPAPPDVEKEEEYMKDDALIIPEKDYPTISYPYYWKPDTKSSLNITDEELPKDRLAREFETKDAGQGEARWRKVRLFEISPDDFIYLNDKPNKNKILRIDNLDDFDYFTDKYGTLSTFQDIDPKYPMQKIIIIDWGRVSQLYKGIFINEGLEEERGGVAYFNGKTYSSWWNNDFNFEDVLLFEELPPPIIIPKAKIHKPNFSFNAEVYSENDFTNDQFIDWFTKNTTRDKILLINSFDSFDEFTNKYGNLYEDNNHDIYIKIDWDKVALDYKGFTIDKDNLIKQDRFKKAFLNGKKYKSWWSYEKIKAGNVYIFIN